MTTNPEATTMATLLVKLADHIPDLEHLGEPEDRSVPGTYCMAVPVSMPLDARVEEVLNLFHRQIPVGILEDFEFFVLPDPASPRVVTDNDGDYKPYREQLAPVKKVSDTTPVLFAVTVSAYDSEDHFVTELGTEVLVVATELEARRLAVDLLWDERLTAADCWAKSEVRVVA